MAEVNEVPRKKKKKRNRKWPYVLGLILVSLAALAFTAYPLVSNYLAERDKSLVISEYRGIVDTLRDEDTEEMFRLAYEYNATLVPQVTEEEAFTDEALEAAAASYYDLLNINAMGMMGYVDIPKIDIYLPIYHGTDLQTLELGVGHILGTSLPVGGEDSHCSLSAHSGMSTQRMFSDLDDMELGDVFYLHIVDETLAYEVCDIVEVLPEEVSMLQIEKGRDLCTLITCTPFGVNTHRLLVTGERIPYEEAVATVAEANYEDDAVQVNKWAREYIKGILIGVLVAVLVVVTIVIINKVKKNRKDKKRQPNLLWPPKKRRTSAKILTPAKMPKNSFFVAGVSMTKKTKRKKRRAILLIFMGLVFMAGLAVAVYPVVNGWYLERHAGSEVEHFLAMAGVAEAAAPPIDQLLSIHVEEDEMPYPELYEAMQEYNEDIYEAKQEGLCDAWSYTNPSFVLEDYGIEDGVMGVVSIPSLDIQLPLYLGATYQHMNDGAVQLSETSLPIGGINTNCVIAAHCGWRGADYFRYLSSIKIGDYVFVTNLWETLVYQVRDTEVILPDDSDKILIQEGKDMVTLFTCHPYASGGKYRFVVYCDRVEDPEAILEELAK